MTTMQRWELSAFGRENLSLVLSLSKSPFELASRRVAVGSAGHGLTSEVRRRRSPSVTWAVSSRADTLVPEGHATWAATAG